MTDINIIVGEEHGHHGHPHLHDHGCPHHDPQEVVPFEKEEDDLPPKEAGDDSRTRELIAQEERASNDYEQLADEADDEDTKEVYEDISDEEKVHAGELLVLLLKQDPKQKEALEEGSEEVKELVGGESFRSMFEKGRGKVIDKANGVSIAKAKDKGQGKGQGKGDGEKKWDTHTQAKKKVGRDINRSNKVTQQGMGQRENPKLGEKSSQVDPQKAAIKQGRPGQDPSKLPKQFAHYRQGSHGNTPNRPPYGTNIEGENDRIVEMTPGTQEVIDLRKPPSDTADKYMEQFSGSAADRYRPPVVGEAIDNGMPNVESGQGSAPQFPESQWEQEARKNPAGKNLRAAREMLGMTNRFRKAPPATPAEEDALKKEVADTIGEGGD